MLIKLIYQAQFFILKNFIQECFNSIGLENQFTNNVSSQQSYFFFSFCPVLLLEGVAKKQKLKNCNKYVIKSYNCINYIGEFLLEMCA